MIRRALPALLLVLTAAPVVACGGGSPTSWFHTAVIARSGGDPGGDQWPAIDKLGHAVCDQLASGKFTAGNEAGIIVAENPTVTVHEAQAIVSSAATYLCPDQDGKVPADWK